MFSPSVSAGSWRVVFSLAIGLTLVSPLAPPCDAETLSLDFSAPGQFAQKFRTISAIGGGTSAENAGGALEVDANSSGGSVTGIYLYDTTPGDTSHATQSSFATTAPISVSFDSRAVTTNSSVAVIFADPANVNNNITGIFNLKTGADQFRFFRDGNTTATSNSAGTQVGVSTDLSTTAEPGAASTYANVSFTLSVSGGVPTITMQAGGSVPVVSAFTAAHLDWSKTLVLIRINDASASRNTPVELDNFTLDTVTTSSAPPAAIFPPAPGASGNLLTVNPGFEAASFTTYANGAYAFTGWTGSNYVYNRHGTDAGTVANGVTTEGVRSFHMDWGGNLSTASGSRPAASPGAVYEFKFDLKTTIGNFPNDLGGTRVYIDFFDCMGTRIKMVWGPDWYPQVQSRGVAPWETIVTRAVAPPEAVLVGVRIDAPTGPYNSAEDNRTQNRHINVDNFRLFKVGESVDRLAVRRSPRLVEPGKLVALKVHHAAKVPRTLRVALRNATGAVVATAETPVGAGRAMSTLPVQLPTVLPNGTYSWRITLHANGTGAAVAEKIMPNVLVDQTVAAPTVGSTDFTPDHPNLQYMGRWEDSDPLARWMHWFGSELRVRFSGTSLTLLGALPPNGYGGYVTTKLLVIVDGDVSNIRTVDLLTGNFAQPLITGLADGIHTLTIFKGTESDQRVKVTGLRVDAGRGLLKTEPFSGRRLEVFGDSVTSGGTAASGYLAYAPMLGRELDADTHIISKGGTGVASSFSNQDILVNYWDNLSFSNVFNAATGLPWDLTKWKPQMVVIAIGHNDQFNNGQATFKARYAEFKGYLRTAYPSAAILTANTLISANLGMFQSAVDPLIAEDPNQSFAFQFNTWSDAATGHPPTAGHYAMVYGDERRFSLAEVVEDRLRWGVSGPLTSPEQWSLLHFTEEQREQGAHLPSSDPDGDGAVNEVEQGLDTDPNQASTNPAERPLLGEDSQGYATLTFYRADAGVTYIVEGSTDLQTWEIIATNPGTPGTTVSVTDTLGGTQRYLRLRIEPS